MSRVQSWQGKMVNVHPSLLPAFPGLDAIARSYSDPEGAAMGVTVHEVTEGMDVVHKIARAPRDRQDRPVQKVAINKVVVLS